MKKVITTVGTSIFENYREENNDISSHYKAIKDRPVKEWARYEERCSLIRDSILKWAKGKENASAEIKSILKLKDCIKEPFDVYLIATDTISSRLAAEIIMDSIERDDIKVLFNPEQDVISDLQIKDGTIFINGMTNLLYRIDKIVGNYWNNVLINITGGYKVTIPYLTILAQINQCDIYYIFEDTDNLIKIPYIPIDIKWEVFEKYWKEFEKLDDNLMEEREFKYEFLEDCKSLFDVTYERNQKYFFLNPLGIILWNKFRSRYFIFHMAEDIYSELEKHPNIKRILSEKFYRWEIRQNKTEIKNGHYVYDDGDNPHRIFYFEENNKIYIYKTFENHSEYEKYLNSHVNFEELKIELIQKSKLYKLEVQNV